MHIKYFGNRVRKITEVIEKGDGANWKHQWVSKEIRKECRQTKTEVYLITVNGIIFKPGGTKGLEGRLGFYASANEWSNNPGQHNQKANPAIWDKIQKGDKVEFYQLLSDKNGKPIPDVVKFEFNGKILTSPVDFVEIEDQIRQEIIEFNKENNIQGEDLYWDGKALQTYCDERGIKEVFSLKNKRIPKGLKVENIDLINHPQRHKVCKLVPVDSNYIFRRGKLIPIK